MKYASHASAPPDDLSRGCCPRKHGADVFGDVAVVHRRELGAIVPTGGRGLMLVATVGKRRRPGHLQLRGHVHCAAAPGVRPTQQHPVEAADDCGDVVPVVLPASDRCGVGLPELAGGGDVNRLSRRLRVRPPTCLDKPPKLWAVGRSCCGSASSQRAHGRCWCNTRPLNSCRCSFTAHAAVAT